MKVQLIKLSNKLTYYIRTKENDLMTALIDDLLKIEERGNLWQN